MRRTVWSPEDVATAGGDVRSGGANGLDGGDGLRWRSGEEEASTRCARRRRCQRWWRRGRGGGDGGAIGGGVLAVAGDENFNSGEERAREGE